MLHTGAATQPPKKEAKKSRKADRATSYSPKKRDAKAVQKEEGKKRAYGTPDSHVVPHRSTDRACSGLTAQFGRDTVLFTEYGRRRVHEQYRRSMNLLIRPPPTPSHSFSPLDFDRRELTFRQLVENNTPTMRYAYDFVYNRYTAADKAAMQGNWNRRYKGAREGDHYRDDRGDKRQRRG